jgi:hypothetical protein
MSTISIDQRIALTPELDRADTKPASMAWAEAVAGSEEPAP